MGRSWILDGKGIATKVKNAGLPLENQIKDCGAIRECPNCHYRIDNLDVSHEWPGFPAGVKFDPSDIELLEHLAAKCGVGNSEPHMFINEFIPTLEREEGICYCHPEDFPGAKKDGSSIHFFHRTRNAYATGQRKRRKIQDQPSSTKGCVRWHKTGKTKSVFENGTQRGCKKIMVLYGTCKKGSKPDKCNWVMHQYHLGTNEDEIEGQYVVSKIFYQQPKTTHNNDDESRVTEDSSYSGIFRNSPRTPKTIAPNPPRPEMSVSSEDFADDRILRRQEWEFVGETTYPPPCAPQLKEEMERETTYPPPCAPQLKEEMEQQTCLAGESQADEGNCGPWLSNQILDSPATLNHPALDEPAACGITDLENLECDSPPDFQLVDLQFGSQDSFFGWLDNFQG